jgi:segregation and condensation protein B
MKEKKALIEAALFMSPNPLDLKELSKISGVSSESKLMEILNNIRKELDIDTRGYELALTPTGYQFRVKKQFLDTVSSLTPHSDLSEGMLRTLGLVAVHQPAVQSEIVKIQGNKAYDYIKNLEKRGLIKTEKFGKTKKLITTKEFEKYFGRSIDEIKDVLKGVVRSERDKQPGDIVPDQSSEETGEFKDPED